LGSKKEKTKKSAKHRYSILDTSHVGLAEPFDESPASLSKQALEALETQFRHRASPQIDFGEVRAALR
jgi:hypothetical protein